MWRKPSPELQGLASLIAGALDCALFGLVLFAWIDQAAPPQDLPWKPLSISDPLGLATTSKLDRTIAAPAVCLGFLERERVPFTSAPDRDDGGFCAVKAAVRLGPAEMRLSPAGPLMACPLATAFSLWTRQVVRPAAIALLGQPAVEIEHYGTYACRRIYGEAEGRPSEHASAEAIDVAAVRLADGRMVSVLRDWRDPGPKGKFLHEIRDKGCRLFRVALSPDYNAAHRNHLHFDMSPYQLCR